MLSLRKFSKIDPGTLKWNFFLNELHGRYQHPKKDPSTKL